MVLDPEGVLDLIASRKRKQDQPKHETDDTKKRARICRHEGCEASVVNGGVCHRHRVRFICCKVEGCTNNAISGGLCRKHGSNGAVRSEERSKGYTKLVICGEIHQGSGAKAKQAKIGEAHERHHGVGSRVCSREGCTHLAKKRGGMCQMHTSTSIICYHNNCTNPATQGGSCSLHELRAIAFKRCSVVGCNHMVFCKGVCRGHGFSCSVEGCMKARKNRGLCIGHGGYNLCSHKGCPKRALTQGVCRAHVKCKPVKFKPLKRG